MRPRIRSGYALKRLEADEGRKRWVLKDLDTNTFLRLRDNDAQLFEQLDGTRSLVDLIGVRRAALRAARARRGSRGCSPTSASAGSWPASPAPRRRAQAAAPRACCGGCSSRA